MQPLPQNTVRFTQRGCEAAACEHAVNTSTVFYKMNISNWYTDVGPELRCPSVFVGFLRARGELCSAGNRKGYLRRVFMFFSGGKNT